MAAPEAQRAARIELGGIEQVKQQVRSERIGGWLQSVIADFRFALRQFLKSPGFTAVTVLTLALGIGTEYRHFLCREIFRQHGCGWQTILHRFFFGPSGVGQIVGVAGNVRETNYFDPQADFKLQIYVPFYQTPRIFGVYLMVRSAADPSVLVPALQERIWSIDKNQPVTAVATLDQRIAEVNASPRSQTLLLGIFAVLGLLLALIGVYGVMSYLVGLQTREIGMRMVHEVCCGLDVHKKSVTACVLWASGRRRQRRKFGTFTKELLEMSDGLQSCGVTHVALESTGVYWKPVWNLLEGQFVVLLVNAQHIKAVPGRDRSEG